VTLVGDGLVVGVDTHKDVHVAVVLDRLGRRLAVWEFPATDAGNTQLTGWLAGLGQVSDAGVEGTGSYGYRLARLLADAGLQVWRSTARTAPGAAARARATRSMRRMLPAPCWPVRRPRSPRTGAGSSVSCGCCC